MVFGAVRRGPLKDAPRERVKAADRALRIALTLLEDPVGAPWWTFGFEAFGSLQQVENDLAATVLVLAARGPPPLAGGETNSYPGWLASLKD